MTQVRLEADVADALRSLAGDASVAQLANRKLRTALGLDRPASAPSERALRSTVRLPGGTTAICTHPIGRRIGNFCAACGHNVKGTR